MKKNIHIGLQQLTQKVIEKILNQTIKSMYSQVHKYWDIDNSNIFGSIHHHNGFQMKRTRCALTADCQL